jgi:ABC-2 type transport system ATP-binding protein
MADAVVTVEGLCKRYGEVQALDGVTFEVQRGEIFGLVGPNGAGKSTTLRIISTLLGADEGSVTVCGADVEDHPNEARAALRYVPEEAGAYENFTGRQYLDFVASFYAADTDAMVDRGVAIADLAERIDSKASEYSKGMTRKLLLAAGLMTQPQLAILDEPTSGLDVRNARQIRDTIKEYPGTERSVILSSHNMLEVEYLCDRVGLLNEGRIVDVGTPAELVGAYGTENLEDAFLEATA